VTSLHQALTLSFLGVEELEDLPELQHWMIGWDPLESPADP
jgi:hypothetical protein